MNLLFISRIVPWPLNDGGRIRRYHLVYELARRHSVTLVTLLPREPNDPSGPIPLTDVCERVIELDSPWLRQRPASTNRWVNRAVNLWETVRSPLPRTHVRWATAEAAHALRTVYHSAHFDAVWVDRTHTALAAEAAGIPRFVVDVDDLMTTWLQRAICQHPWRTTALFDAAELAKSYWLERAIPKRAWRYVVCKEDDRKIWGGRSGRAAWVIPNGVADLPISPYEKANPCELLFVGSMDHEPNADAVRWFSESVLPLIAREVPDVRFVIAGRNPLPSVKSLHDGKRVIVTGRVDDLGPVYDSAAVVVAPLRVGSGTKLKVLEALGRGKGLVGTTVAEEGLRVRPGTDMIVADTPAALAAGCLRLLRDPLMRKRMGEAGRQHVREHFSWEAIGRMAEQVLTSDDFGTNGKPGSEVRFLPSDSRI